MTDKQKLSELINICKYLAENSFGPSTSGNVSLRIKNKIYITATGLSLKETDYKNLSVIDLSGKILNNIKPSKEYNLHLFIYQKRPDINSIIHVHPPYTIALISLFRPGQFIPSVTQQFVKRAGLVPIVEYYPPGSMELANRTAEVATDRAVSLQNHGAILMSDNFKKAYYALEELEENCKIWLLANGKGKVLKGKDINYLLKNSS